MKKYRIFTGALLSAALLLATSCGSKQGEATEETEAEIEAAMMMGRNVAKSFATRQWKDTLQLQSHLLEARSEQSKYVIAKKPKSAEAFDSGFLSTMHTVRPDLSNELDRYYDTKK